MGTKVYDNALDLLTFSRASGGTALRKISYGSELVTNGGFDSDASGWTASNCTVSVSSGVATLTATAAGTAYITQTFAMAGLKAYVLNSSFSGGTFNLYDIGAFTGYLTSFSSGKSQSYYLTDTDGTVSATYYWTASGAGDTITIDNVSVKEVLFDQPDGTLTLFNHPNNVPRIEYAADGTVKGLLIEEQRTNLVTYSEDFTHASWNRATITVSSDSSVNPAGDSLTYYIEATSTGAGSLQSTHTLTSTPHTLSFFVKYKDNAWVRLGYESSAINAAWFNIQTGAKGSIVGAGNTSNIQDFGDGWYRISLTVAAPTTSSTIAFIALSDSDGSTLQTGGTSAYIYGAQLEAGSFATSYISTSGIAATRSADIASIPVSAFGYNQKAGGLLVVGRMNNKNNSSRFAVLSDGTTLNRILTAAGDNFHGYISASGIAEVNLTGGAVTINEEQKVAFSWKENSAAVSLNAASVSTDNTCVIPDNITKINIGSNFAGSTSNSASLHIRSITYYPRRLTNTQLQELTA